MQTPDAVVPGLRGLLPGPWARYRPVVVAALEGFVAGLSPERQREILAAQLALPAAADSQRLVALARACPTLHKLGQIVARDERLAPRLSRRLMKLESLPPVLSRSEVEGLVRRELPADAPPVRISGKPLAQGSVALVAPCRVDLDGRRRLDAVVKVILPGVEARLEEELALWPTVAAVLQDECAARDLPSIDFVQLFDEVEVLVRRELELAAEREHLEVAARLHSPAVTGVAVPEVLPGSSERLTLMTRLRGRPVGPRTRSDPMARALVRALVAAPLLSQKGPNLVHGDPHAGNLIRLTGSNDAVGVVDWTQAAHLSHRDRRGILAVIFAGLTLDRRRLVGALAALAAEVRDREALERCARSAIDDVRGGTVPGLLWLISVLDRVEVGRAVRFPARLVLLRKAWLTLEGVLAGLDPEHSSDRVMTVAILRQALVDGPRRALSGPFKKEYGLPFSNLELLRVPFAGPTTLVNLWREVLADP